MRRSHKNKPKSPPKDKNGVPVPKGNRIVFQTDGAGPVGTLEFVEGRFNFTGAFTESATKFFGLLKSVFVDPYVMERLGKNIDVGELRYRIYSSRAVCPGCNKKSNGVGFRIHAPVDRKRSYHICDECVLKTVISMEENNA